MFKMNATMALWLLILFAAAQTPFIVRDTIRDYRAQRHVRETGLVPCPDCNGTGYHGGMRYDGTEWVNDCGTCAGLGGVL